MHSDRTTNSLRNILSGIVKYVLVGILIPFVLRTMIIKILGEQYLGLNSLFTSILSVLNLADLGFGTAINYSLYEPFAKGENVKVCALLNLYRKIYRAVAALILIAGLCVLPFITKFIKGSYPSDINIYILFLIYLTNTVLSYSCFAHQKCVLYVAQRIDIDNNVNTVIELIADALKILILVYWKNYFLYVIFNPIVTVAENIWKAQIARKMYPHLKALGKVDAQTSRGIIKRVSAMLFHKIGGTISYSLDSLVTSAFLGLTILARYSNYYYIVSALQSFMSIIYSSIQSGIGNSIATETIEKNYSDFMRISFMNMWLTSWFTICFVSLCQDFMRIWLGDSMKLLFSTVVSFGILFYVISIRSVTFTYKDAMGMWWEDKFKPLVAGILNLCVSIILVQIIGVNGVIISSIVSGILVELPWENYIVFKLYFKRSSFGYYKLLFRWLLTLIAVCLATFEVCSFLPNGGIFIWIIKAILSTVVCNTLFFIVFSRNEYFKSSKKWMKHITAGVAKGHLISIEEKGEN